MIKWSYFHSMDPFILQFTDTFGIRWYSMAYILGFFISYFLIKWLIHKQVSPLSAPEASNFIVWVAFGVILGGRLGYAIFYSPKLFLEWDSYFPFWGLLKIHEGGLASHGGIVGLIIAIVYFAKKYKLSVHSCLDLAAFGGFGVFLGRITNFINGELYGRVIEGKAAWLAVQFPQEMFSWVSDKKIESLKKLSPAISKLKQGMEEDTWTNWIYQFESTGQYKNNIYSGIHSLIQACEEGNQAVISSLKEVISYRHPSQLYQAFLEGLLPFLVVCLLWNRKKLFRPGVIGGIWVLIYSFMRILGEQFRMPDTHLGFRALGLTRGQWLTISMLIGIVFYLLFILRKKKQP